jgi:Phage protein Gp138 N-terminal domain
MDPRERFESPQEAILAALAGAQADLWTALPGIIQAFDPNRLTCTVQPAVQARVQSRANTYSWVNLPLLLDCPVVFPGGGGFTLTFPLQPGDECLVVFSSRCIDGWWQLGGIRVQPELRMHDLSDGFVLPGVRSLPRPLAGGVNGSAVELRSDDGSTRLRMDALGGIYLFAPGGLTVEGNVNINGSVQATGNGVFDGTCVCTLVHSGVRSGTDDSGPPV